MLQVQQAVDALLAFGPVSSAVEAAKPALASVRAACGGCGVLGCPGVGRVGPPLEVWAAEGWRTQRPGRPWACLHATRTSAPPGPRPGSNTTPARWCTPRPPPPQAREQYFRYHDSLLGTRQYRQAYNLANQLAQRAQQTWLYNTARARLPASAVETGEGGRGGGGARDGGRACCRSDAWTLRSKLPPHSTPPTPIPTPPYRPLPAATPYFNSVVQHLKPIAA